MILLKQLKLCLSDDIQFVIKNSEPTGGSVTSQSVMWRYWKSENIFFINKSEKIFFMFLAKPKHIQSF